MNTTPTTCTIRLTALAAISLACTACGSSTSSQPASTTTVTVPAASASTGSSATTTGTSSPASTEATGRTEATSAGTASTAASSDSSTTGSTASTSSMRRMHVTITDAAQVEAKLAGTSESFRAFIQRRATETVKEQTGSDCKLSLDVTGYWPDDQAMGGITDCGGANTLWFRSHGGAWQEIPFQSELACADLRAKGVPHAIPTSTGFTCAEKRDGKSVSVAYTPAG